MAIRTKRFLEYRVNLYLMSETLTGEEVIRFYEGLCAPQDATRWLTYFDPALDFSGLDLASVPKIKRAIALKQRELFADAPAPRVLVCNSRAHEDFFVKFWSSYVATGDVRPVRPAIVSGLEAACDRLDLPDAARSALRRAIDDLALVAPGERERVFPR